MNVNYITIDKDYTAFKTEMENFEKKISKALEILTAETKPQVGLGKKGTVSTVSVPRNVFIDTPYQWSVELKRSKHFAVDVDENARRIKVSFSNLDMQRDIIIAGLSRAGWEIRDSQDEFVPIHVPARIHVRIVNSVGALLSESIDAITSAVNWAIMHEDIPRIVKVGNLSRMAKWAEVNIVCHDDNIAYNMTTCVAGIHIHGGIVRSKAEFAEGSLENDLWELADISWTSMVDRISYQLNEIGRNNKEARIAAQEKVDEARKIHIPAFTFAELESTDTDKVPEEEDDDNPYI